MTQQPSSDNIREIYDKYVGSLTPQEFIAPYLHYDNPIEKAVQDYLKNYPFSDSPPSYLARALHTYLTSNT